MQFIPKEGDLDYYIIYNEEQKWERKILEKCSKNL